MLQTNMETYYHIACSKCSSAYEYRYGNIFVYSLLSFMLPNNNNNHIKDAHRCRRTELESNKPYTLLMLLLFLYVHQAWTRAMKSSTKTKRKNDFHISPSSSFGPITNSRAKQEGKSEVLEENNLMPKRGW